MPTAQQIKHWLKNIDAVSTVSEEDFYRLYLPAAQQPEDEEHWNTEQETLVEAIGEANEELDLYTGNMPLLQLCNLTSKRIYESQPAPLSAALVFYSHHSRYLRNRFYKEKNLMSPDIIVLSHRPDTFTWDSVPSIPPMPQEWSNIVAIGEVKLTRNARYQTAGYLLAHLQHRPELHSVLGFSADINGYTLFYHDASVIHEAPFCPWTSSRLLHAFIRQLYQGIPYDPSMRTLTLDEQRLSIEGPDLERILGGWMLITDTQNFVIDISDVRCDPGLGRRRFTALAKLWDSPGVWFIKDNYRDESNEFAEGDLFKKAHDNGKPLPGLMRVYSYGYVNGEDANPITTSTLGPGPRKRPPVKRCKTRMITEDVGLSLKEVKSLREFLGIMYDACAVQRNLYRKSKILHCDISDNNIMVAPRHEEFNERWKGGYHGVKYLNQVLAGKTSQMPPEPQPACLVIDLGNAVDLEKVDRNSGILTAVTGTPKFMARSISCHKPLSKRYLPRSGELNPPMLEGKPRELYILACGTEYEAYNTKFNQVLSRPAVEEPEFMHQLVHDAESTFWVIAWFLACSAPKGYHPETDWNDEFTRFIRGMRSHRPNDLKVGDPRLLFEPEDWEKILHPSLAGVAPMLTDMHSYIDPEWSYRPDLDHEHAHDALMRLLLVQIIRIEDRVAEDIEFAGQTRNLPAQTESAPFLSASTTNHLASSLKVPRSGKRSRSRSDDSELANSSRSSPHLALLKLQEVDQTGQTSNDILDYAQNDGWKA